MKISDTITVNASESFHPCPWRVKYWQRCKEWHPKSCPQIVDANGKIVVDRFPQNVGHPGEYDVVADLTAITIVDCVNAASAAIRCPECGYTQEDCKRHGDHNLCSRFPFFSWESNQMTECCHKYIYAETVYKKDVSKGDKPCWYRFDRFFCERCLADRVVTIEDQGYEPPEWWKR